jgi:L-aspartate oxidase
MNPTENYEKDKKTGVIRTAKAAENRTTNSQNRIAEIERGFEPLKYAESDQKIKVVKTDFLIIGSGIAGLSTALKLSKLGRVVILTKEQLEDSNTQFAQGGIAAVLDQGDSWQLHLRDTLKAGAGLCNRKAVEVLVTEGPARVKELIKLGTQFDLIEGELDLTQEGAHSRRRILHARGDATGVEIRESLSRLILDNKNITMKENTFMVDLLSSDLIDWQSTEPFKENIADNYQEDKEMEADLRDIDSIESEGEAKDKQIIGAYAVHNQRPIIYLSRAVILASGGCSMVYINTSNPEVTTGDGIAVAYRAGADIKDMEFVQFHPTTLYNPGGASFLISESLRGEGAVLRNKDGKRFMPEYHHLADLAPRDIVARAIVSEAEKDGKPYVYLDATDLGDGFVEKRFPTIYNTLMKAGVDMSREMIPVVPAAHYLMGGVKTDTYGRTNLKGLYACGEVACTGVHGANRLASNSLLEGLVFGRRIYSNIKDQLEEGKLPEIDYELNLKSSGFRKRVNVNQIDLEKLRREFRVRMTENVGIERDAEKLNAMLKWIDDIERKLGSQQRDTKLLEFRNMLSNGKMIATAALLREESRGGHYRSDFPETRKEWSTKHIVFNINYPEVVKFVLE